MPNQLDLNDDEFTPEGEPLAVDQLLASDLTDFSMNAADEHGSEDGIEDHDEHSETIDDDGAHDELPQPVVPARRTRGESAAPAVPRVGAGPVSIYERLAEFGILKKVTDIVLAKVATPWHLREDAAQEVHATWLGLVAKPNFARNQIACYAFMSGKHAALKLRRNIGAVVVIPGALFRTGRDTAFMESIGAAVQPKDVDDYKDSLDLSVEPQEYTMPPQVVSADYFKLRLAGLPLSKSQRAVAERVLVRRMSAESIATEMNVRPSYVERLLGQVTQMLNDKDDTELSIRCNARLAANTPAHHAVVDHVGDAAPAAHLRRSALQ